jgi:cell division protease FtsH
MGPEKKSRKVLEEDKRIVAYHEAGHAILGHYLPHCDEVHTVTIVPRGAAGGFTLSLPEKEYNMQSRSMLLDDITMMFGGHAAVKIVTGDIYTGAQSDLQRATELARVMITKLGMSPEIGTIYLGKDQEVFVGMEFGQSREYSENVQAAIDAEVANTLSKCYQRALSTLEEHMDDLHGLADLLIEKETVNREDFLAFMNRNKVEKIEAAGEEAPVEG